jgi:hypothetical protein
MDAEDYRDLMQDLDTAHRMIAEMCALFEKLHTAWGQQDENRIFSLIDCDVYDMLQRFTLPEE